MAFELGSTIELDGIQYTIEELLGSGTYAHVFKAKSLNQFVALKVLKSSVIEEIEIQKEEAFILEKLNHPNIIKLISHGMCGSKYVFVLEYFQGMDLYSYITLSYNNMKEFDEQQQYQQSSQLLKQIIKAVDYLHNNGVYHRDLKPENILIQGKEIKIIDFGLSTTQLVSSETECGSYNYMSYENQYLQEYNNQKNDIWSLSTILVNLVYFKQPFQSGEDVTDLDYQHFTNLGCSYLMARLLMDKLFCLEYQRINAKQLNVELNKIFNPSETSSYISPKSLNLEKFQDWDEEELSLPFSNSCSQASKLSIGLPIINGSFDEGF